MVAYNPGNIGRKLLISISRAAKLLKGMLQGLHIVYLIARFCLESAFSRGECLNKPFVIFLRWLAFKFPESDSLYNALRLFLCNIVRR